MNLSVKPDQKTRPFPYSATFFVLYATKAMYPIEFHTTNQQDKIAYKKRKKKRRVFCIGLRFSFWRYNVACILGTIESSRKLGENFLLISKVIACWLVVFSFRLLRFIEIYFEFLRSFLGYTEIKWVFLPPNCKVSTILVFDNLP